MISRGLPIIGSIVIWFAACLFAWQAFQTFRYGAPRVMPSIPEVSLPAAERQFEQASPIDDTDFSQVLARPLFAPNRRPVSAVETVERRDASQSIAETTQSDILPEVIVYGVAISGALSKAFLSIDASAPDWYGENDIISGWTLKKIEDNGVLLQSGTVELRIELY
ncbi:hypothetical protein KUV51_18145 [Tateyamaria omphalii]|uniref:hypothetical protein n=1 Tax=Tateyamaria omphalii TaxID=299262 RepID=UPI001C9A1C27|nr:hypothetical protein [Tateyamaria omphalii]MBY5934930.1 hypothetical protein [Tateyamaria omphalii]